MATYTPVSGYACLVQIATNVAGLGTGTAFNLATDFTLSASQGLIEGAPTFGSSTNGVIDPSYITNGIEKMDFSFGGFFDPQGVSTAMLLAAYHATTAADKTFGIKITIGGYSLTATGMLVNYTLASKADGSIVDFKAGRIALYNASANSTYQLVTLTAAGTEND